MHPKSPTAPGGSATSAGTCQTPASSNGRRDGARRSTSRKGFGSYINGLRSIAGRLLRRGWSDHEGSADKPELVIRGQYLFRVPRTAFSAGVWLRKGSVGARGPYCRNFRCTCRNNRHEDSSGSGGGFFP